MREPLPSVLRHNVWYVTDKADIDRARLDSAPPAVGVAGCSVPSPAGGPSCTDRGAVARDFLTLYYYQVRVSCDATSEGP